ncbi:MAG: putative rane protein [Herbinix sp.]|jgi:leader peptidase (prepilin peptidase)/N-methyltransferase|nr:putative rane protein [Herbinix sp.]
MSENIVAFLLLGLLILSSIQDLLKKRIGLWIIILGGGIICAFIPFYHTITLFDRLGGVVVGGVVIVISLATGGKIGLGDGLLLCITGIGLGFWSNLELFALALLFAAILSIILMIFRLADRKKSIPFVPFLLLGYVFILTSNMRGWA